MRTLAREALAWGFNRYDRDWERVARIGATSAVTLDTRLAGWRYLSLNAVVLTPAEVARLRILTEQFGQLLDWATAGILEDLAWWPELAWPWAAIELARQEPPHPGGATTLYGRFDWLLDAGKNDWQLVEYNADTPSGGREVTGLDPAVKRLHAEEQLGRIGSKLATQLTRAVQARLDSHAQTTGRPVRLVGIVSAHGWLEDISQAWWLGGLLRDAGQDTVVGDVRDVEVRGGRVTVRGREVDALYRFFPVERLYRHGVFAPLMDAALDGRVLLLNGLRSFLAQSKAVLAWLWAHRGEAPGGIRSTRLIERHLPLVVPARSPGAQGLLADSVVKHVNGREGAQVVFGDTLVGNTEAWEARLIEGGYVVQRRVQPVSVEDVSIDEHSGVLEIATPRLACVGAFCIGGRFGGCYTRLDGPITTARAAFVPTFVER